jgi:hypothetical protein
VRNTHEEPKPPTIAQLIELASDDDLLLGLGRRGGVKTRRMGDGSVRVMIRLKPTDRPQPARRRPQRAHNPFGLDDGPARNVGVQR